jgi:hypothetical protein
MADKLKQCTKFCVVTGEANNKRVYWQRKSAPMKWVDSIDGFCMYVRKEKADLALRGEVSTHATNSYVENGERHQVTGFEVVPVIIEFEK